MQCSAVQCSSLYNSIHRGLAVVSASAVASASDVAISSASVSVSECGHLRVAAWTGAIDRGERSRCC